MKVRWKSNVFTLMWFITLGLIFSYNSISLGETMSTKISEFKVEKDRITDVASKLACASQLSICVEEGRWFSGKKDTKPVIENLNRKREAGITLKLKNSSVEEILNKLITVVPNYIWERNEATGIINIYPRKNAPLGWKIKNLVFEDSTIREIFISNDLLGFKKHGIHFFPGRGKLTWLDTRVSLNANNITARQVLNQICKQLNMRWELSGLPLESSANAMLTFQGYLRYKPEIIINQKSIDRQNQGTQRK